MTPSDFIKKWADSRLRERQGAQEHFIDLCHLLGEKTPAEDDPFGERYCFERGAEKVGGGDGWADVWRRGCFGWEYKGKHKDLGAALRQLQAYALDLQNPPYLVVSDMERIVVHTNWTNTVSKTYVFGLDDLRVPARLDQLRDVFHGSERLRPGIDPQELTKDAAQRFGALGRRLQERGHEPRAVAHFLNRVVFCLFAEYAGLLPNKLFTRMLKPLMARPRRAERQFSALFEIMREGGLFGADEVRWFNGGLFDDSASLPLEYEDLKLIADAAAEHDWSEIDPAIFGTLYEEALKATRRRAALGAHYTDRPKIMKIVEPVIVRPLMAEWEMALAGIRAAADEVRAAEDERRALVERLAASLDYAGGEALRAEARRASGSDNFELFDDIGAARLPNAARRAFKGAEPEFTALARRRASALTQAREIRDTFLDRLAAFTVLDPACGSGNFLYVALHALRDIELRALMDAERLGVPQVMPQVSLKQFRGIEIEAYAAELARVTLWIGDLQWKRRNGYTAYPEPVLEALDGIEARDALLTADGTEAEWPEVDVIVGNPPFLGGKRLRAGLGGETVERLFRAYKGRVPAEADFVCYWVEKAWQAVGAPAGAVRAGLVTTNSIRGGANRRVLEAIATAGALHEAWADEPWVLEGAAVRVSMLGFGAGFGGTRLDGAGVLRVNADLTAAGADLTHAKRLKENAGVAFMGDTKGGAFDVPGEMARQWLKAPLNPNGRPNSDVLKPWRNAMDVTRRSADKWIIDFGWTMGEQEAALYEAPFGHVLLHVQPERAANNRELYRQFWWRHVESRQGMWRALQANQAFIACPRVAKHRLFVKLSRIEPDSQLIVTARDDATTFGVLHSWFHEIWSLRMGTWLGVGNDPRYTPSTTFETFPFPEGLTPNIPAAAYADDPRAKAIAEVAAELNRLREAWLNPPDLVKIEPEVVPGYPDRILPRDEAAAAILKKRTLTNLYNDRPAWLDLVHRRLDAAVAAAYGWPADLDDEAILERLFALNQERAAAGR